MQVTLIDFLPLSGALVTLLVLVSIVIRSKTISIADYVLVTFLFICFLSLLLKFITHSGYIVEYIHLNRVNNLLGILRPPLFFLYIYFAIHPQPKQTGWHVLHFIPFVILLIYLSPYLLLPSITKLQLYHDQNSNIGRLPQWYPWFGMIYSIVYLAFSAFVFRMASTKKNYLKTPTKRWIASLLIAHAAFLIGAAIMVFFQLSDRWDYLAYHILTFSIILCCIILLTSQNNHITEASRPRHSGKDAAARTGLFEKVKVIVEGQKLFLNEKLRIRDVSEKTGIQEYVLSQIINDEAGMSFAEFINQYRIEEAKSKLMDEALAHLTIEAIGSDSGFNTKASFYSAFKKHTGQTPTEFKQQASK
jgi:AraC-like DNA-binding protein